MKYNNFKKGYTLLFAVLTSAVLLGVATFILGVSRKQYILASAARESTYAIYAADSGIECAVAIPNLSYDNPGDMICNDQILTAKNIGGDLNDTYKPNRYREWNYSAFKADPSSTGGSCAKVKINFEETDVFNDNRPTLTIESRGYNYCVGTGDALGPDTSNPKTVERALRFSTYFPWL
jgi:hypothetical protein